VRWIRFFAGRWWGLALLALLAGCAGPATPPPQNYSGSRTFPATGFTVENEFLHFFEKYGGEESLGPPISAEMEDGGWRVQYFEKGRLEYHPENAPEYRVTVGWLGDLLNRRRPPVPPSAIPAATETGRRYFPDTGHTLSGDFLTWFDEHGGTVRFGRPISQPFLLEGRLAQDFQSARFFWAPEQSPPVELEAIGRVHLEFRKRR